MQLALSNFGSILTSMVVLCGLLLWGLSHAESALGFCRISLLSVSVSSALGFCPMLLPCGHGLYSMGAFQVSTTHQRAQPASTTPLSAPMAPLRFAASVAEVLGPRGPRPEGSPSTVKSKAHLPHGVAHSNIGACIKEALLPLTQHFTRAKKWIACGHLKKVH